MPENIDVYGPKSCLDIIIPKLQEQGLPCMDLADSLRKYAEDYQVFYKYDTHWNMLGAFIASQQIAEVLLGESVSLEEVNILPGAEVSGIWLRC